MFFQNKQYMTLEVAGTENGAVQAIVFCILQGTAARSAVIRAASFRKGADVLAGLAADQELRRRAQVGCSVWEDDGGCWLKFPAPESAASRRQRSRRARGRSRVGCGRGCRRGERELWAGAELWGGWKVKRRQRRVGETESEQQERKTDLAVTVGRDRSRELRERGQWEGVCVNQGRMWCVSWQQRKIKKNRL